MDKCKFYNEFTWCDPPLEEDENGTLVTEYKCKNAQGYFVACCGGNKEHCTLPDNQNKELLRASPESPEMKTLTERGK